MHRRDGGAAQSLRRQFSRRWRNLSVRRKSPPIRHRLSTRCVFVAKKQSSAKRKRKGCRLRLRPSRGSNLPNNGASWRTGVNDTLAERFKSLAPFQSPNRRMPCIEKCIWHEPGCVGSGSKCVSHIGTSHAGHMRCEFLRPEAKLVVVRDVIRFRSPTLNRTCLQSGKSGRGSP
jgi:hypothetical protein